MGTVTVEYWCCYGVRPMTDQRFQIDKDNLDAEFVNLPELMRTACEEAANAVCVRDAAEETLKEVDAELDKEIRVEGIAGKAKLTEAMVEAAIQTHPKHQEAFRVYNEAKWLAAKAIGQEKAIKTKEKSLEQLATLYLSAYWVRSSSKSANHEKAEYSINRQRLAEARRPRVPIE